MMLSMLGWVLARVAYLGTYLCALQLPCGMGYDGNLELNLASFVDWNSGNLKDNQSTSGPVSQTLSYSKAVLFMLSMIN